MKAAAALPVSGYQLRPYQRAALDAVRSHYASGARRMLLVAATGAGKTVVFSHLAEALELRPSDKVLVLAHRDELIGQAADKYASANPAERIGIEKGSSSAAPFDRVAIASVQTLRGKRIADFVRRFGRPALVVTDEAHHSTAAGYQEIYQALGIAKDGDVVHVGVTATPKRSDGVGLSAIFDVIAHSIGIGELIEQGYLVPLTGYRVQTATNLDRVRTVAGDFNQGDLDDAVDTDERNARVVQAYRDLAPGRQTIVFAASVQHSQNLAAAFEVAGVPAIHVDGAMAIDERRAALRAFGVGRYQILTNCQVATEGYDEPSVSCVIVARPTKSPVLFTQMVGRCTRLHPGKDRAVVIDLVDVSKKHSVVSLPTLFGMPSAFDLQGKSVTEVEKRFREIVGEAPELESMLTSAADLEDVAKINPRDRFHAMLDQLLANARQTQGYIDVNLLKPPELDPEIAETTGLAWVPMADGAYVMRIGDRETSDTLRICADLVGKHTLEISRARDGKVVAKRAIEFADKALAFDAADGWVRRNHGDKLVLVDRAASWRDARPSEKQLAALARFRIANPEQLTRGKASELLDMIFAGIRGKKAARA